MISNCSKHGITEHSYRKDNGHWRCRKCMVDAVNKRRKKLKRMAVEYKGGSCERCGYDKCIDALDFHHLNPQIKEFSVSSKGHCRSWKALKNELDKCELVCANCHREIHSQQGDVAEGL